MARWCIGIDLGGTFIKFAMMDADRRTTKTFQLPTPTHDGSRGVVEQMIAGARQAMQAEGVSPADVLGVGVGAPGPMNIAEGVIVAMPNIPGMENVPLRDLVGGGLNLPAVLENDANAAAYGEYICGAGAGRGDMVLLTLGTGVGSGIIVDGKILHGVHEIGAEMGHMIVEPGGEQCNCGQRGCLERYTSATYMADYAARLIRQGRASEMAAVLDSAGVLTARDINEARRRGDALAAEVWDRTAMYLALACVNICRIFDPDEIVLAGGMTRAGDDLMTPLREHFERLHWSLTRPRTQIVLSRLGNDAGVIGAAGVAWSAFGG